MRFKAGEESRYGGQGGSGFLKLNNDKDVADVRFMYDTADDIQGDSVHEVKINGKKRYVNCLRDYNEPMDVCPFCKAHMHTVVKLFIPVYNINEDKVQIWERGKKFFQKMSSLASRYPHLVSNVFQIERNGKAQDTNTTYEIYEMEKNDGTTMEDLPPLPEILGNVILDKTADDMEYYLQEGQFPPDDDDEDTPVRRRTSRDGGGDTPVRRRTPATQSNEDVY